ncbi:MAG: DNA replication/repair protein RecF [Patescibacteria group bacterium]
MQIHNLKLKNFRNHENLELSFNGKSQIIIGQNGIGKSNILEAIYLVATTKSLRAEYDRDMINHNNDFAIVEVSVTNHEDNKLEVILTKSEKFQNAASKKVKLNGVSKKLRDFAEHFNSVLFSPPDIELFTGTPSNRRKYLDLVLSQIDVEYKRALADYTKAVKQRNKILELISEFGRGEDQLEFWTKKTVTTGTYIQKKRTEYFNFLAVKVQNHGKELNSETSNHEVIYDISQISEEILSKYAQKEIYAKRTLIGPHRDDFRIILNNYNIAKFGSRGQQRAALLALKISEMDFINEATGMRPVLLLDDIFSELDYKHKQAVFKVIPLQQTIITSAEPIDLEEFSSQEMSVINL